MPERRTYIDELIGRLDIPGNIFPAIRGADLDRAALSAYVDPDAKLTPGEIGCLMSHVEIMKKFGSAVNTSTQDYYITFEDDITTTRSDAKQLMMSHIQKATVIDPEWDLFYFGRCHDKCSDTKFFEDTDIIRVMYPSCMHAYAVRLKSIDKILGLILPANEPIDLCLRKYIADGTLHAYASNPPIFTQKGLSTTIPGRSGSTKRITPPTCRETWGGPKLNEVYVGKITRRRLMFRLLFLFGVLILVGYGAFKLSRREKS